MWEELWDLPQSGALSACLLLLITSGAVVNSVIYEKRLWCRYFCPIGAMNKMFATLSMTEVRTWKSNCEGCTTAECINGGSPTVAHDNYALKGCTMDLKNNQLRGKSLIALFMYLVLSDAQKCSPYIHSALYYRYGRCKCRFCVNTNLSSFFSTALFDFFSTSLI
mmetsp:Transcript_795/g.1266  ORF Transcript_795/g.1266 Transcript_795/m.1266 type:complete len:165 (+) Transcript_795:1-495(+)